MNKYTLELTEEELNFIYDRCSNKAARLEDSNLEDTPCYRLAHQVMHKIYESKKDEDNPLGLVLEISQADYDELRLTNRLRKDIMYLIKEEFDD
jgi:hypothetical protein